MYKIMVVEDDDKIAEILCDYLDKYGYEAIRSSKFQDVKSEFLWFSFPLVPATWTRFSPWNTVVMITSRNRSPWM